MAHSGWKELSTIQEETRITGHLVRICARGTKVFGELTTGSSTETHKFIYFGKKEDSAPDILALRRAPEGSSVTIIGELKGAPAKATQAHELHVQSAVVHSVVEDPATYPYGLKMHKKYKPEELKQRLQTIRGDTYRRFRDKTFLTLMRMRGFLTAKLVEFFYKQDFTEITTPIFTRSDCEGAGEMFTVTTLDLDKVPKGEDGAVDYSKDFFGAEMHTTVSGQLDLEAAARELVGGVYTFGPSFRAEHSKTSRHLAEFKMLEPEKVFTHPDEAVRFSQLLDLEEAMVKFIIVAVIESEERYSDLCYLDQSFQSGIVEQLKKYQETPFARITYTEAIDLLKKHVAGGGVFEEMDIVWGMDLGSEHERWLCEKVFGVPTFVTHYPQDLKSFYMKADSDCVEGKITCQAVDLLVPGIGELCGGSMREDCPEKLEAVMKRKGMSTEELQWYIDLRKDGGMPTGGFGLGFARLVAFITGVHQVRDVVPFPRTYDA